jgi:putative transposase
MLLDAHAEPAQARLRPSQPCGTGSVSCNSAFVLHLCRFLNHYSAECVGIHAAKQGTRFEALEPLRQGVRTTFGAFGQDVAQGLMLRHDHGSQYMSQVFQEELRFWEITSSPAFVREPEGNGCAERFIRTLKENLLWLTTFETVEELRLALHEFQRLYNETWLIGRHGYKTPAQARHEQRCALAEAA